MQPYYTKNTASYLHEYNCEIFKPTQIQMKFVLELLRNGVQEVQVPHFNQWFSFFTIYFTDLYDTLVAPTLKTDLVVETWRRGSEIPLDCKLTYHANDALSIHVSFNTFPFETFRLVAIVSLDEISLSTEDLQVGSTTAFSYTKDHSKMAHSADMTKPWVCIGDINRMVSKTNG